MFVCIWVSLVLFDGCESRLRGERSGLDSMASSTACSELVKATLDPLSKYSCRPVMDWIPVNSLKRRYVTMNLAEFLLEAVNILLHSSYLF